LVNGRRAELLAMNHVAALRPKVTFDRVGQLVDAARDRAGIFVKLQ